MNASAGSHPMAPSRLLSALAAVLAGLVFLIAGGAKLSDFSSFARTIQTLTQTPGGIAPLLALVLITAEIAGGTLLVLALHQRVAATALAGLVTLFLLFPVILGPAPERCNCFGPLLPFLDDRARTALDFGLLALLALVALPSGLRARRWSWILSLGLSLLAVLQLTTAASPVQGLSRAVEYAGTVDRAFARAPGNRALLLLDASDFLCPPCYQDIRWTVDTLSRLEAAAQSHRAVILLKRKTSSTELAEVRAQHWSSRARILLPTSTIADSLLGAGVRPGSAVAVIDDHGSVLFHETFPLDEGLRHRLLDLLYSVHDEPPG